MSGTAAGKRIGAWAVAAAWCLPAMLLVAVCAVATAAGPPEARYRDPPAKRFSAGHFVEVGPVTEAEAAGISLMLEESEPGALVPARREWPVGPVSRVWRDGRALLLIHERPAVAHPDAQLVIRVPQAEAAPLVLRLPRPAPVGAPPDTDVFLLIDDSHSMRRGDPGNLRTAAVGMLVQQAADFPHVRTIAIGAFADRALLLVPPTPVALLPAPESLQNSLVALGRTNLDAGLMLAIRTLQPSLSPHKVIILLSDGRNAPGPYAQTHAICSELGMSVQSVGLSRRPDLETLGLIAAETGGRLHQVAAAADLEGVLAAALTDPDPRVLVAVEDVDGAAESVSVLADGQLSSARLTYLGPAGLDLTAARLDGDRRFELRGGNVCRLRITPGSGHWQIARTDGLGDAARGVIRLEGTSRLALQAFPLTRDASGHTRCDAVLVGWDGEGDARMTLRAEWPGGSREVPMRASGGGGGALSADLFSAAVEVPAAAGGILRLRIRADIRGADGATVTRMLELEPDLFAQQVVRAEPVAAHRPQVHRLMPLAAPVPAAPVPVAVIRPASPPGVLPRLPPVVAADPAWTYHDRAVATPAPPGPDPVGLVAMPAPPVIPALSPVREVPLRPVVPHGWRLPLAILLWALLLALLVLLLLRVRVNRMVKYVTASVLAHILLALLTLNFMIETGTVDLDDLAPSLAIHIRSMEQELGVEILPPSSPRIDVPDPAVAVELERAARVMEALAAAPSEAPPSPDHQAMSAALAQVPVDVAPDMPEARPPVPETRRPPVRPDADLPAEALVVEQVVAERESVADAPQPVAAPDRPVERAAVPEAVADVVDRPIERALAAVVPARPAARAEAVELMAQAERAVREASAPRTDLPAEALVVEQVAAERQSIADAPQPVAVPERSAAGGAAEPVAVAETVPVALQPHAPVASATARPEAPRGAVAMLPPSAVRERVARPEADSPESPPLELAAVTPKQVDAAASVETATAAELLERMPSAASAGPAVDAAPVTLPAASARPRATAALARSAPESRPAVESVAHAREARRADPRAPLAPTPDDAHAAPRMPEGRRIESAQPGEVPADAARRQRVDHSGEGGGVPDSPGGVPDLPGASGSALSALPSSPGHVAAAAALARSTPVASGLATARAPASPVDLLAPPTDPPMKSAESGDAPESMVPAGTAPARATGLAAAAPDRPASPVPGVSAAAPQAAAVASGDRPRPAAAASAGPIREPSARQRAATTAAPAPAVDLSTGVAAVPARARGHVQAAAPGPAALAVPAAATAVGELAAAPAAAAVLPAAQWRGRPSAPVSDVADERVRTAEPVAVAGRLESGPQRTAVHAPVAGLAPPAEVPSTRQDPGDRPADDPSRVAVARTGARSVSEPERPALPGLAMRPVAAASVSGALLVARPSDPPAVELDRRGAEIGVRLGQGGGSGSIAVDIPLARYQGDWDSSPTAMLFLAHNLEERTGLALQASSRVVSLDSPDLHKLPFVYMTGHLDFRFTDAEIENLRRYLNSGGHLWADDSTHFNDETFDRAFRRELRRVLPAGELERLDSGFKGFSTGYDLTRGYKGYAIPPGDKYRADYLEGVRIGDRVAVVYSRNDYGDGLGIDPHTHPLMESLTDLSPQEMQEGALRMGINLALYFLSASGRYGLDSLAAATADLDSATDASADPVPTGRVQDLAAFREAGAWQVETWADPAELVGGPRQLTVRFQHGQHEKSALSRTLDAPLALSPDTILLLDAESRLRGGARLALGFHAGDRYFETRPAFLKPGRNTAVFPMDDTHFKTAATDWEYTDQLPPGTVIDRITALLYAPQGGTVILRDLRLLTREE